MTVTEGLPLTSSRKHPFMFSLPTVSLMDSFPLAKDIFISPFSLPATCISVDYCLRGTENTLKLAYWGGDVLAHINGKSGLRAAAQTILSNCFLFSISRSTFIVLTPFSDIPPPAPWCQGGCVSPALHAPRFKSKRNITFTPIVKPKLWVQPSDESE